jgi:GH24 family phage-related lysozyme (muramidase)
MINARTLSSGDYADRARFVSAYFEESGNIRQTIYADSVGVPTIGIGFNLRVTNSLNEVLETFGFDLVSNAADRSYRDRLATVFAGSSPSLWQSGADAIMAERAASAGAGARSTFEFFSDQEIYATFDELIITYENQATSLGPSPPLSFDRLAIVDMAYNGILASSNKFRAAFDAGDRAEAWYEITFNSNYGAARASSGSGIMRRRYLEGELFGLYDKEDGTSGFRPSESEALKIFRMVNKHENQISGEIAQFPNALHNAQIEWDNMLAAFRAAYGEDFAPTAITPLAEELAPAFAKLVEAYVDDSAIAALTGLPSPFAILASYAPSQIFVAADVQGTNPLHAAEVAARTVDRNGKPIADDLIFGSLTSDGTLGAFAADTLRGAAGDDWIVSGGGADLIDGGTGFDVVDYANSPSGVTVGLNDGLVEQGGFAEGDNVLGVQAIIGSAFGDTLTGDAFANLFASGGGADSIFGGDGTDFIVAGAGADTVYGGAKNDTLDGAGDADFLNGGGGHDRLAGGNGNDVIRGAAGYDAIFGGKGFDYLRGGTENDFIDGGELSDTLLGESGDDTLGGGDGADLLFGGVGADVIVFGKAGDADEIRGFTAGSGVGDVIRLVGFGAAFDTFAEVLAAASDNGLDTTIDLGGGDSLILRNVLVSALSADDFLYG